MIVILRGVGVVNAALWFGSTLFFTFLVGPAFFSEAMLGLLTRPYAGAAAQIVLERYFVLQLVCGVVALVHLIAETVYLGRPLLRWTFSLLAAVFVLGLVGGFGIQPKLNNLHRTMYHPASSSEERAAAGRSFRVWHGVSQGLNLAVLVGVTVYLLRVTRPNDTSRFRA